MIGGLVVFAGALLWVGPTWEALDVLIRDEAYEWTEALLRGALVGIAVVVASAFLRRRSPEAAARAAAWESVAAGRLPDGGDAGTLRTGLGMLRRSRSQDRVAFPVLLLASAGLLAAAALRTTGSAGLPLLLAATALAAAPVAAIAMHRHLRTAERLLGELEEPAARG